MTAPRSPKRATAEVAPVPRSRAARTATAPAGAGQPASLVVPTAGEAGPRSPDRETGLVPAGRPSLPGPVKEQPGTGALSPDPATGSPPGGTAAGRGEASQTPAGTGTSPTSLRGDGTVPAGTRTFTLELPAGLKLINLNERLHWSEERRRAREIKKAAWAVALAGKVPRLERVRVTSEYQPPDLRHRDGDNYAKSAKHALDGIVAAGCLPGDDERYVTGTYCRIGTLYPKGRLVLTLTEVAATGGDAA